MGLTLQLGGRGAHISEGLYYIITFLLYCVPEICGVWGPSRCPSTGARYIQDNATLLL